jgi:hypothetical protein
VVRAGCELEDLEIVSRRGLREVVNKSFLACVLITISTSLDLSQDSNHFCGHYIMTCASISSSIPLMKNYLKNRSDWPFAWISN